jgi:hypothetical protein
VSYIIKEKKMKRGMSEADQFLFGVTILLSLAIIGLCSMRFSQNAKETKFENSVIKRAAGDNLTLKMLDSEYRLGDFLIITINSDENSSYGYLVDFTKETITLEAISSVKKIKRKLVSTIEKLKNSSLAPTATKEE